MILCRTRDSSPPTRAQLRTPQCHLQEFRSKNLHRVFRDLLGKPVPGPGSPLARRQLNSQSELKTRGRKFRIVLKSLTPANGAPRRALEARQTQEEDGRKIVEWAIRQGEVYLNPTSATPRRSGVRISRVPELFPG